MTVVGRKRKRLGLTSVIRYKLKMFRVVAAGVPEELAREFAESTTLAWELGFSPYHNMHERVREQFFQPRDIPLALRGFYLAFCNELQARVLTRGIETVDYLVEKWTRLGLDPAVLRELVDFLCQGAGSQRAGR